VHTANYLSIEWALLFDYKMNKTKHHWEADILQKKPAPFQGQFPTFVSFVFYLFSAHFALDTSPEKTDTSENYFAGTPALFSPYSAPVEFWTATEYRRNRRVRAK